MKKLIGFLLVLVSFFLKDSVQAESKEEKKNKNNKEQNKKMKEAKIFLSRAEIAKKLKELKKKPLPKELSIGAECYEVAQRPDRIDYICPVCNQKTIHSSSFHSEVLEDISIIRSMMKTLAPYQITLDERVFCQTCSQQIKDKSLCLNIPYAEDGKNIYRRCSVNRESIALIIEFLQDKDRHESSYGSTEPLLKFISRLEELFGVKSE